MSHVSYLHDNMSQIEPYNRPHAFMQYGLAELRPCDDTGSFALVSHSTTRHGRGQSGLGDIRVLPDRIHLRYTLNPLICEN